MRLWLHILHIWQHWSADHRRLHDQKTVREKLGQNLSGRDDFRVPIRPILFGIRGRINFKNAGRHPFSSRKTSANSAARFRPAMTRMRSPSGTALISLMTSARRPRRFTRRNASRISGSRHRPRSRTTLVDGKSARTRRSVSVLRLPIVK